jgi:hypothetical protein
MRGEISVMMWLVFGLIVTMAVIFTILSLRDQSMGIVDMIAGWFG